MNSGFNIKVSVLPNHRSCSSLRPFKNKASLSNQSTVAVVDSYCYLPKPTISGVPICSTIIYSSIDIPDSRTQCPMSTALLINFISRVHSSLSLDKWSFQHEVNYKNLVVFIHKTLLQLSDSYVWGQREPNENLMIFNASKSYFLLY